MDGQIGWNPQEIMNLNEDIKDKYSRLGSKLADSVRDTNKAISDAWVGEDSLNYRKYLTSTVDTLYEGIVVTYNSMLQVLVEIGNSFESWQKSQSYGNYSGSGSAGTLVAEKLKAGSEIESILGQISEDYNYAGNRVFGLDTSKVPVAQNEVQNLITAAKSVVEELKDLSYSKAFYGEYQTSVTGYVGKVVESLNAAIQTADNFSKELDDSKRRYSEAQSTISTELNGAGVDSSANPQ